VWSPTKSTKFGFRHFIVGPRAVEAFANGGSHLTVGGKVALCFGRRLAFALASVKDKDKDKTGSEGLLRFLTDAALIPESELRVTGPPLGRPVESQESGSRKRFRVL
jgi:hypothetical protein